MNRRQTTPGALGTVVALFGGIFLFAWLLSIGGVEQVVRYEVTAVLEEAPKSVNNAANASIRIRIIDSVGADYQPGQVMTLLVEADKLSLDSGDVIRFTWPNGPRADRTLELLATPVPTRK